MQRKSSHKPTARPTKWPAVFHFSRTEPSGAKFQFDLLVRDEEAWSALLVNVKNFSAAALKAVVVEKNANSKTPISLSIEDLRTVELAPDVEFHEPTKKEADGDRNSCTVCTGEFQPVKFPRRNRFDEEIEAGNYGSFKTEQLAKLKTKLPEVYTEAEQFTIHVLEGQKAPEKLVVMLVCPTCTTMFFSDEIDLKFTGLSRSAIIEQVLERDISIKSAIRRNAVREALGGKRRDPEDGRQGRGGRPKGRDNQQQFRESNYQPGKVNFYGANYYQATGEVLQLLEAEGKIPKGQELEFVVGLSNEKMVELKIIDGAERISQADQIRRIAKRALDVRKELRDTNARNAGKGSIPLGETKGRQALENAPAAVVVNKKKPKPKRRVVKRKPAVSSHRPAARRPAAATAKKKAKMATANER